MLKVVKKWYSDIQTEVLDDNLLVVMRDNAGENKSQEILYLFELMEINALAMAEWTTRNTTQSIMMILRTIMVESGLYCRF